MGPGTLKADLLGIDPIELARFGRLGSRLLFGIPSLPHGASPRRRLAGNGLELLDRTAYVTGHDPRLIDWRASARAQETLVRRFQDESLLGVYLCLDRSASMGADGGAKWLLARRVTAALAHLLADAGSRVGLIEFSEKLDRIEPAARGRGSFARILAALASQDLAPDGRGSRLEACGAQLTAASSVIVVSDFLTPDVFCKGLDLLQHRRGMVQAIQILSLAETTVAAGDPVSRRDVEPGERRRLRSDRVAISAATARLEEQSARLRGHCHERGIPLTQCDTAASWRDVIVSHLRTLEPFHA
jgi:uncharacterized protein (DUF58 family)